MSNAPTERDNSIDVLKGLGIFFVILNHSFARGSRKFMGVDITTDPLLYGINRAIHFAVPIFLFISCALLARSLARSYDLKRYSNSRFRKTVVPYLVASFCYAPYFMGFPWQSTWDWNEFLWRLSTGRAQFHLYFTIVLIQISVVVPFLVWAVRGRKPNLWITAAIAILLQLAIYELQRRVFQFPSPGSIFLWYLVPLGLGLAVGMDRDSREKLQPLLPYLLGTTLLGGATYVYFAISPLVNRWTSSDAINLAFVIFTAAMALSLWTLAPKWPTRWVRKALGALGAISLPVFLIHPAVMHIVGGPTLTNLVSSLPGVMLWYFLVVLFGSFGAGWLLMRTRVGRVIAGQE